MSWKTGNGQQIGRLQANRMLINSNMSKASYLIRACFL